MTAFTTAWSLLKSDAVFTMDDVRDFRRRMREEKETGTFHPERGNKLLDKLMGVFPLRQQTFNPVTGEINPTVFPAQRISDSFKEGYKKRMDTSPRPFPAKVVRIPDPHSDEYGQGVTYELQDKEGNLLSQLGGTEVDPEDSRYGKHIENAYPILQGLHGNTPTEHQRRGFYQRLLNTILRNNYMNILSTSRNQYSQPFHESFQRRLPPSIDFKELDAGLHKDWPHGRKYLYQPNRIKQSKEREKYRVAGWGDLQPDYGLLPMVDEPEDERITNLKRDMAQGYQTQARLDDRRFLPEYDVEHPNHRREFPYFRTKDGVPYSTADVVADPYHWEYSEHPYSRALGDLFA